MCQALYRMERTQWRIRHTWFCLQAVTEERKVQEEGDYSVFQTHTQGASDPDLGIL